MKHSIIIILVSLLALTSIHAMQHTGLARAMEIARLHQQSHDNEQRREPGAGRGHGKKISTNPRRNLPPKGHGKSPQSK